MIQAPDLRLVVEPIPTPFSLPTRGHYTATLYDRGTTVLARTAQRTLARTVQDAMSLLMDSELAEAGGDLVEVRDKDGKFMWAKFRGDLR